MASSRGQKLVIGSWALCALVCLLAITAWGGNYNWNIFPLNAYLAFPVLGLLAFSIMWTHYVIGTARDMLGINKEVTKSYYHYTGWAVLILICLHPGLLIFQLFIDGAGLPPLSYERYVGPGLGWVTLLGSASLLVFLAYELHRVFDKKPWWQYVVDASDFAMLAIVYHGLRLGSSLHHGWYRYVWWFYAISLTAVLIRKYSLRIRPQTKTNPTG